MATKLRKRRRRQKAPRETDPSGLRQNPRGERLRHAAAAVVLVLAATRPLVPSEDAAAGSGLLFVLLCFFPLAAWAVAAVVDGQALRWNYSPVDLPLAALLAWVFLCAFRAPARGPALTLALEWFGLAVLFWSLRSIVIPLAGRRVVIQLFVVLATLLALYAIYQAFWGLEALRREFAEDRMRLLVELGITPGSRAEQTFLNRLNSHEAFGTFALANSLAGFLLPWAVLLTAWALGIDGPVSSDCLHRADRWRRVLRLAMAVVVLVGVVLTQSRSAYLAYLLAVLPLLVRATRRLSRAQLLSYAVLVGTALAAVAVVGYWRGKFDEKLFTGAWQSLAYRTEYWQATLQMIRDHPLFGVGPGNFRSHYLRYKLPDASEEVTDPHNFLLELAASFGVPGLLLFLITLAVAAVAVVRGSGSRADVRRHPDEPAPPRWAIAVLPAAAALAWWAGGADGAVMAGVALGGAVLVATWSGAEARWRRPALLGLAVAALLVQLLFAGGIQFPGVAIALWATLACALPDHDRVLLPGGLGPLVFLAVVTACFVAAARGFVLPHLTSRALVAEARQALARGDPLTAIAKLRQATELAPWHAEAWALQSQMMVAQALRAADTGNQTRWHWLLYATLAYQKADPASPWPCRDAALVWAARARRVGGKAWAEAIRWIRRARERYPGDLGIAYLEVKLLVEAGRDREAAQLARQLLERNRQCPHPDRKLADAEVENLKRWARVGNDD